jgi:plastocyanin
MQLSKTQVALALTALLITLLTLSGSALAAGKAKGPAKAKITIKGGPTFKTNGFIKDSVHFAPGPVTVSSGGTVTLTNVSADEHTLSIVKSSQVPHSLAQVENCSVCGAIAKSHGVNPEGPPTPGPPPIPLVNVGAVGFDVPGDSIVIGPKGHGSTVTFKVTAAPNSVLSFICAIHPWMQGHFLVK